MSKPVATLDDLHSCPHHGVGPITSAGQEHVKLNGVPIAVEGGACQCVKPDTDPMVLGASSVRINGKAVMRVGDLTAHGGAITTGKASIKVG